MGKVPAIRKTKRLDQGRVAGSAQAPGSEMCSNEIREPRYGSPRPALQINYALVKNPSLPPPAHGAGKGGGARNAVAPQMQAALMY